MSPMDPLDPLPQKARSGVVVLVLTDGGRPVVTRTRSEPWQPAGEHSGGRWLVMLEGKAGGFALERCYVLPNVAPCDLLAEVAP